MVNFEVLILGSSSATPMFGRNPSAQILRADEQLILIDCGEGTQMQLSRFGIKANRINHIFISHLHGDHYLGLIGLISSMNLMGRKKDLKLYGPKGLDEILDIQFKYSDTQLNFKLHFVETNPDTAEMIYENQEFKVTTFPLEHRIPCTGFLFQEKASRAKIDVEKVKKYQVPVQYLPLIKDKNDYQAPDGRIIPWQELTLPMKPTRSYAYCSDTRANPSYLPYIKQVDMLYHEATFLHDMLERANETYHTTAHQAGEIAHYSQVKTLLIGHFSARYREIEVLKVEASKEFSNTHLAIEGCWYSI